jgi:hypothetical protein
MAGIPSIKGSIVAGHGETLKKYLVDDRPADWVLEERFKPGELDILTGNLNTSAWYDIRMYERLLLFLRDYVGEGNNRFLIECGQRSAEKLLDAGIHQQFEYLSRTQVAEKTDKYERHQAFGRDLRLLSTITGSILNFAKSGVIEDPENPLRWVIQHANATSYPEALCWTSQGFCNRMAEVHGHPDLWYWERPRADLVEFRMNREI